MAQVKTISKKNIFLIASISFFMLGVIFFSLSVQKYQILTSSRAEFDDTACNADNDGTLQTSGSTSWTIVCSGNVLRRYNYALFWCPEKQTGATYCIPEDGGQKIDESTGASLPAS